MTLHVRFIRSAKQHKGKTAFVDCSAEKTVTYSKALIASLLMADEFGQFHPGFIGIMLPTSAGCALASIAALMSGRVPVMINYSTGAAENAEYAQGKCGFETIITSRKLVEKIGCRMVSGMVFLEDLMQSVSPLKKLKAAALSLLPAGMIEHAVSAAAPDDTAVILFTSGSEKDPKAVELSHRNILANIESISRRYHLVEEDRFLCNLPFFHVFGLTANLWAPLYHGMTAITTSNPLEYRTVCEIIRRERPTLMAATPSFYWGYLKKSEPGDFESLRIAIAGADKCPDALREAFLEKHGLVLFEAYGATETAPGIAGNGPGCNLPGSVGRPFDGVEVRIEHLDTGAPCATGETGRIMVRADSVMKGYYDDLEATSLHVRNGWYDTGDMGWLDAEGYLWHAGRLRRFVKIGGEMVSLVRVENVLEKHLPEDVRCCVVEVPDITKGARIVAATTRPVDAAAMTRLLAQELPPIALPKEFMVIEQFPEMGSGKIDFRSATEIVRRQLRGGGPAPAP